MTLASQAILGWVKLTVNTNELGTNDLPSHCYNVGVSFLEPCEEVSVAQSSPQPWPANQLALQCALLLDVLSGG